MRRGLVLAVLVLLAAAAGGSTSASPGSEARVGSLILFWSDTPYPSLWSIRPDGTHRKRLLRTRRNCKRPALSPNRQWIVFDGGPAGQRFLTEFDIQLVRRDGKGRRSLTSSKARETDAQWSPDGTRISYSRLERADQDDWRKQWVWTMRADGSDERQLVRGGSARWSPDGNWLVFGAPTARSDGDLFVIRPDGTGLRRLLSTPRLEWPTAWSRDGRKILFTRFFSDHVTDMYVMNVDGSGVKRMTRSRGDDIGGTWSPNGTRIVFASTRFGASHLFTIRADGTRRRQLTRGSASDFDPVWR